MVTIEVLCCEEQFLFFFSEDKREKHGSAVSLKMTFLLIRFYENKWLEYFFLYIYIFRASWCGIATNGKIAL